MGTALVRKTERRWGPKLLEWRPCTRKRQTFEDPPLGGQTTSNKIQAAQDRGVRKSLQETYSSGRLSVDNDGGNDCAQTMIIFSASSLLASPDKSDVKQIHIIFNKIGNDYDRLTSLFLKYSLTQDGTIGQVTSELYQMCFHYTMSAKIAPIWNVLGYNHLINNRDFLTAPGPQDGIQCTIVANKSTLTLQLKPEKIHLIKCKDEKYCEGESIRVLPSLNKGVIEEYYGSLPQSANFKCYKDLRRHWKNIHGYRLPEEEHPCYYAVRFWRGDPLTYPAICLTRNFPIITPLPKPAERQIIIRFINCLKNKMPSFLGIPLTIEAYHTENNLENINHGEILSETQAVSLCTPTQYQRRDNLF